MPDGFHEISFPLSLSLDASGGPERRNEIVQLSNGRENRNARWRDSRRRYNVGGGMRRVEDLSTLISFFEARGGSLYGFRFKDPIDYSSSAIRQAITNLDQILGVGDGETTTFQLIKTYADTSGSFTRTIRKPISGTVVLALDGQEVLQADYSLDTATGSLTINQAPPNGVTISAGFEFEVPVRFDLDRLDLNLAAFNAGQIPSIPLVEIKP